MMDRLQDLKLQAAAKENELQELKLQHANEIALKEVELKVLQLNISLLEQITNKQQKDINVPCTSNSRETLAIPEQTATGKELTNPLMPSILAKDINDVQTSTHLVRPSDIISGLRPNTKDVQSLNKSEDQTSVSVNADLVIPEPKNYYAVFNGPYAGIYTNWQAAKSATEGVSGIKHQKYKTLTEAKVAGDIFARNNLTPPIKFITGAESLKATFTEVLKRERKPQKMVSLGRIISVEDKQIEKREKFAFTEEGFAYLFKHAREANEEHFISEKFFTTDKADYSLYNFMEGADPNMINEAFRYGLVKSIYSSKNLLEISLFPEEIKRAIKFFRIKVIKEADKAIFLKISSSLPIWKNGIFQPSFHLIEIGISKEKIEYYASRPMKIDFDTRMLEKINLLRFGNIVDQILKINDDSFIRVNYRNYQTLVISKTLKEKISKEDIRSILNYEESFTNGQVMVIHSEEMCSLLKKAFTKAQIAYSCRYCCKRSQEETKKLEVVEEIAESSSAYSDLEETSFVQTSIHQLDMTKNMA